LAQSLKDYEENPVRRPQHAIPESIVIPLPAPEDLIKLEENIRTYLEVPVAPQQSTQATSVRYFYQPLPRGSVREWPTDAAMNGAAKGMTCRNIAIFLTMPEFIYSDYERNKGNGPKNVFVTPDEAIKRPHHKLLGTGFREPDDKDDNFSVTHVGTEIAQKAQPIVINIPGLAAQTQWKKIRPPLALLQSLERAKADHKLLKAEHNKHLEESAQLTKQESATARTLSLRKIHRIEQEIQSYEEKKLIPIPNTGREAAEITIPPCPEGSEELFPKMMLRHYIQEAFEMGTGPGPFWDYYWSAFENKVIRRAHHLNLVRGWPNAKAQAEWWSDGCPAFGCPEFKERYGWYASKADAQNEYLVDVDSTARDNALTRYVRGEGGAVADDSIRRVGPGTVGGWHGAGAGPSSDERGDSLDYHKDRPGKFDIPDLRHDPRRGAGKNAKWDRK
jgi:hypothetical protein